MGAHKGWLVKAYKGKWMARVRVDGSYKSKTFARKSDANEWAKSKAAEVQRLKDDAAMVDRAKANVAAFVATRTTVLAGLYLDELKALGRSESHRKEVRRVLDQVAAVAPDLEAPSAHINIRTWLNGLEQAAATRNRFHVTVRGLCRWAVSARILTSDPTDGIRKAAVAEYLRPQFTVEEIRTCLSQTQFKTSRDRPYVRKCWEGKRIGNEDPYHRLFAVMIYTGMRFGEAATMDWGDIDWSGGLIRIEIREGRKIKRNRERLVPLQKELRRILLPVRPDDGGPMFKGRKWNPGRGFAAFLDRAGVDQGDRSPHSCRHTYAGLMTATGVPGPLLGAYLGHSSAATTMGYTKLAAQYAQHPDVKAWPMGQLSITETGET